MIQDDHFSPVQSSLGINIMSPVSNLESDMNAHTEHECVRRDFDEKFLPDRKNCHGHVGIDLTGDRHNSIGIF